MNLKPNFKDSNPQPSLGVNLYHMASGPMNHNDKNSSASDDLRACVSILPSDDLIKRCFDVIVSFSAIIFLLPILLSLALMIKLNSSGPILFRQERTGLNQFISSGRCMS
jgi:lipopolysaccharide/colanic/teichoic acid biosynthesis glycosyltransferase